MDYPFYYYSKVLIFIFSVFVKTYHVNTQYVFSRSPDILMSVAITVQQMCIWREEEEREREREGEREIF
jgi:hypothetical protein